MLHQYGGMTHATALGLIQSYYAMYIKKNMQKYLVIILPWGKYVYLKMLIELNISADVFQRKLSRLFEGMPYALVYIDDILIITKGTFEQHSIRKNSQGRHAIKHRQVVLRNYRGRLPRVHNQQNRHDSATFKGADNRRHAKIENKHRSQAIRWNGKLLPRPLTRTRPLPRTNYDANQGKEEKRTDSLDRGSNRIFREDKKIITEDAMLHYPDLGKEFEIHTD